MLSDLAGPGAEAAVSPISSDQSPVFVIRQLVFRSHPDPKVAVEALFVGGESCLDFIVEGELDFFVAVLAVH
jgi:hypothetical protein